MMKTILFTLTLALSAFGFAFADGPNVLTAEEQAAGWKLLFDGKTVSGFRGLKNADFLKAGWKIEDGALVCAKDIKHMGKITGGDLATVDSFLDFDFSFEWRTGVAGNSGVLYFARAGFMQKATGHEYQLIDDTHHPDGLKGGPIRRTGALYGVIAPSDDKKYNMPPQWNESRIVVQGNHVEHWLNGAKVLEYNPGTPEFQKAVLASKAKVPQGFGQKVKSQIILLDEGDEIAFRNLKIRALAPEAGAVAR
jgi:hypothetical protein